MDVAPQKQKPTLSRWMIIVSIIALLLLSAYVYYESSQVQIAARDSSSISGLQNTVDTLKSNNQALQAEVAVLLSQRNSSGGLDPAKLYSSAEKSVVTVQGTEVTTVDTFFGPVTTITSVLGSGFVVGYQNSPYIVTNYHVVNGVSNLTVTFSNGDSYWAKTIGSDVYSDLAVLTVNAPSNEFNQITLAGSGNGAVVGEGVYAIGNPFGLSGSMTFGIVSQTGRTITESTSSQVSIPDIIQFSAPINPGNSGGPLLDSNGLVIGITTASASNSQGLYFAIPSSTILRELPSLISTGSYAKHPYLGLSGAADMNLQLAQAAGVNVTYGVLVESVTSGSPAAQAGLRAGNSTVSIAGSNYAVGGDIITSVNGTRIVNQDALAAYLEENAVAGETVQLGVMRSGTSAVVNVVLGSLPGL